MLVVTIGMDVNSEIIAEMVRNHMKRKEVPAKAI
jgi:hypothetical protein